MTADGSGGPAAAAPAPAAASPGLVSDGLRLEWHLARPVAAVARGAARTGIVIAHGMPLGDQAAMAAPATYAELADRVARDTGWAALSFSFRGAGRSPGQFTPGGWLRDLQAAVELLRGEVSSVWLAGFGLGGALALRVAALDPSIGGVALLGAPSDLSPWLNGIESFAASACRSGYVDDPAPSGLDSWIDEIRSIDPLGSAAALPPRPLLMVHGSADEEVSLMDARALADAAEGAGELRVIAMAGHRLRHDPRAVALLLGWLERHEG